MRVERLSSFAVAAVAVLILTSCEDQEARSKAEASSAKLSKLEGDVAKLQADLDAARKSFESLKDGLSDQINKKLDGLNNTVTDAEKRLRGDFTNQIKDIQRDMQGQVSGVRQDFDARVEKILKVDLAKSMQDIRGEIGKNRDELLGFMDKQLKELYPYAYQPKRMDPNEQPNMPQK